MEIVKAIKYVDMVVPQENRNKVEALEKYNFQKMFVGDDWKGTEFFMSLEPIFKEHGAEIVYFPYTKGTSSTFLKEILSKI